MTDLIATGAIGLSPLDWGALILYLLVVMAVGLSYAKGERDTESYLLGGRSIAWWAVGISFTVSLTSTLSFVGTPGEAYEHGLTLSMSMLVMPIAAISSFYLFVRFHFKQRMFTPFELPGAALRPSRTRHRSRPFLADSSQLFGAGALFVVEGAAGWNIHGTIVLVGAVGIGYTILGGIRAVVWTDLIQVSRHGDRIDHHDRDRDPVRAGGLASSKPQWTTAGGLSASRSGRFTLSARRCCMSRTSFG